MTQIKAAGRFWRYPAFPGVYLLSEAMPQLQSTGFVRPLVAVVDDDQAVCNSLKFSLELEGFAVRVYQSGAEFLAAGTFPDCKCFIIDQRMPGMSGMELILELRGRNVSTPAILIIGQPNRVLSALAAKAHVPIIEKPLLNNALMDKIREVCAGDISHANAGGDSPET